MMLSDSLANAGPVLEQCRSLFSLQRLSAQLNLPLSTGDLLRLVQAHSCALENTGRVEFEGGALETLLAAFHDSPYLTADDRTSVLCELIDLFYHLKNETRDRICDDDLILCMRHFFDEPCHGSTVLLSDMLERSLT